MHLFTLQDDVLNFQMCIQFYNPLGIPRYFCWEILKFHQQFFCSWSKSNTNVLYRVTHKNYYPKNPFYYLQALISPIDGASLKITFKIKDHAKPLKNNYNLGNFFISNYSKISTISKMRINLYWSPCIMASSLNGLFSLSFS